MDDEKTALLGELHRYRTALEQARQHIQTCQYRHTHWCDEHSDVERIVKAVLAEPSAVTGEEEKPTSGGNYLDERWSLGPGYAYVKHGAYVWVFAGERKQYEGFSVGPTPICQTTPGIAQRIVSDHNAALSRDRAPSEVTEAAERLLARKMLPTGTNLPMDVEIVARWVLTTRPEGA